MKKTLYVFYEKQLIGTLHRNEDLVFSYSYSDHWLKSDSAFALSLAMPLSQQKFENKITLSFFENLLPEGDLRKTIETDHDITGVFDFLEHFGKDCAGAVTITENKNFKPAPTQTKPVHLTRAKIDSALSKKKSVADVIAGMDPGYLSLAGAQDKFAAIYKENKFFLPTGGAPTTHIVKVPIVRNGVKDSVYNELFCMQLARAIGFDIPPCEILEGDYPLFIIQRYDRTTDSKGRTHRLHQQDFCQAQGITSEFKHEAKGGPKLKDNYNLLLENATASKRMQNLKDFLNWVCFNLLIGNNDSHSKNISFLLKGQRIELAPFYDLLCTSIYTSLKKDFSFYIGGRNRFEQIGLNQFHQEEENLGIKKNSFVQRMKDVRARVLEHKDRVTTEVLSQYPKAKIAKRISQLISKRAKGLTQQGITGD